MLPISLIPNALPAATPDALPVQSVLGVMPVNSRTAGLATWARLKPGLIYQMQVLGKQEAAQELPANQAQYRIQLNLADAEPLQMLVNLPKTLNAGQTLNMQWLGFAPQPSFKWQADASIGSSKTDSSALLASTSGLENAAELVDDLFPANQNALAARVNISPTSQQLAVWQQSDGYPSQDVALHAQQVVTHTPEKSQVLAQDLKHALDHSGLFYESHLKNATLGVQSWQSLQQEPQNQAGFSPAHMVAQQLNALEQNRVTWQGEVWSGQAMRWDIYEAPERQSNHDTMQAVATLQSDLSLHLPNLGEVKASIVMVDGHLKISLQAQDAHTIQAMQQAKMQLAMNMVNAGLKLEALSVQGGRQHATA